MSDHAEELGTAALSDDGIERRNCKACGCPLLIAPGPNGKRIPLDARSVVYSVTRDLTGHAMADPLPGAFVSHFRTCSSANQFSGGKRK